MSTTNEIPTLSKSAKKRQAQREKWEREKSLSEPPKAILAEEFNLPENSPVSTGNSPEKRIDLMEQDIHSIRETLILVNKSLRKITLKKDSRIENDL